MAIPKATALRLASNAMDSGAVALRGPLALDENGTYTIGGRNLSEWLVRYLDQQVIVILAPIDTDSPGEVRQCGACGRDYAGSECPHCADVRARLRRR